MKPAAIKNNLKKLANKKYAGSLQRFFKTGPGEYAEGDIFLGVSMTRLRKFAQEHTHAGLGTVSSLLISPIHEERMLALLILTMRFPREGDAVKKKIYALYLKHTAHINNWDLVDLSAAHIVGAYLAGRDKKPLYALSRSSSLWERRISIISTLYYIKDGRFEDTLRIAENLINDREDLIHKAVGWMLREAGKRDPACEKKFLKKHYKKMPRTMLRYAIERFPEAERQAYLKGRV